MSAPATGVQEWRDIDWATVEKDVHGLQRRIYRASQKENRDLIHRLQRLLMSSWSAKCLAVRKVTQDNRGKNTAGIDGVASLEDADRLHLAGKLSLDARPKPVRRVWIPKPGNDEKRPLGIPTLHDRAQQALTKLALEPEWEARFEPNSYGFRPGRSCHDAIEALFKSIQGTPKYVLDADIAKCFDRISQGALLDKLQTFPLMRRMIQAWLEAGVMDGDTLFPTEQGTPQGGVISPLLANVALHGLEQEIHSHFPDRKYVGKVHSTWKPNVIRYADDFVVLHRDRGVIQECQAIAQEWLKGMGLELKPSKTRISHTLHEVGGRAGFDFLGFTIRHFPVGKYHSGTKKGGERLGLKTIITPSTEKAKLHYRRLAEIVRQSKGVCQKALIKTLNPIIKGWCSYYRTACSKATFSKMDHLLHRLLLRWAKGRHKHKGKPWIIRKYWQMPGWVFGLPKGPTLHRHSMTKIIRHVKVEGTRSPFDGDWKYWASRQAYYPGISYWLTRLLKRQEGKCVHCGLVFLPEDLIETHHIKHEGKRTGQLEVLHRHCHDVIHGPGKTIDLEESIRDKD